MYRDGKELLLSMAYFCLTVVEIIGAPGLKGRQRREVASKLFNIDVDVLNKLGALTSERGDRTTARKARPSPVPLSDREQAWIEAAIKMLVVRVGEYSSGQPLSQITMAHLPFLAP